MSTINLDRPRTLKFTTNNTIKICDLLGVKSLSDVFPKPGEHKDIGQEAIRALLYGGLVKEDPTLNLEKVGDLMDLYRENGNDQNEIFRAIVEAMNESKIYMLELRGGEKNS